MNPREGQSYVAQSEQPEYKKTESESDLSLEMRELKNFLLDSLYLFLPYSELERLSSKEMFDLYWRDYMGRPGDFSNFRDLLIKYGGEKDRESYTSLTRENLNERDDLLESYRQYLLHRLPSIRQTQETDHFKGEEQIPLVRLERLASTSQMFVGFHVSDFFFEKEKKVDVSLLPSTTVSQDEWVDIPKGHAHYSASPDSLSDHKKYIYLIEGSRGDLETKEGNRYNKINLARGYNWATTARKIPILKCLPLTDDLIEQLDLKFVRK